MKRRSSLLALILTTGLDTGAAVAQDEVSWPRQIDVEGGTVVLYQPQIEVLKRDRVESRAAVSWNGSASEAPIFGAVWLTARLETDRDTRIVRLEDIRVPRVLFPDSEPAHREALVALFERELPRWEIEFALEDLIAAIDADEVIGVEGLKHDPPRILVASEPTVLVLFDGEPRFRSIDGADGFEAVVNTPYLVVRESGGKRVYLSGGEDLWYAADSALGPWAPTSKVPRAIATLAPEPDDEDGDEADGSSDAGPPAILVATEAAELIVTVGPPRWSPVEGVDALLYLENSDSDVFLEISSQHYYALFSGRWYRAPALCRRPSSAASGCPTTPFRSRFRTSPRIR